MRAGWRLAIRGRGRVGLGLCWRRDAIEELVEMPGRRGVGLIERRGGKGLRELIVVLEFYNHRMFSDFSKVSGVISISG